MCSAACASSRFLRSEAYGGSFPTTPIPGCMSYWISWALITGCTHGLQVRVSSERLEGRLLKITTGSIGQGCEMVVLQLLNGDFPLLGIHFPIRLRQRHLVAVFRRNGDQCSGVLGKAGSAPTQPSAKEAGTNAGVQPYASRHLDDVRAGPLAEAGDFVGEADLHGEEGIGCVLDHLGAGRRVGPRSLDTHSLIGVG